MYLATCSGIKLARTRKPMKTLVVCIKIFKDEYIAKSFGDVLGISRQKFCLEIPSDVLLSEHWTSSTHKHKIRHK